MTDEHIALELLRSQLEWAEENLSRVEWWDYTDEELDDLLGDVAALRSRLAAEERRRYAPRSS